jgi:hypothetical protein
MAKMEKKTLSAPDEQRSFDKAKIELVGLGEVTGHDAWVVGRQPVVAIDISGMAEYAKHA